jgi:ketosteroid isomerase-like protein
VIAPRPDDRRVELAADFVRRFVEYWSDPSAERLDTLLAEQVRLVAPLTPSTDTLAEGKRAFGAVLDAIPDLTNEVRRWGVTADGVLIEFTLSGTVGGRAVSWDVVDRFVVGDDGLATERVSYFDPAAIQSSSPT